MRLTWLDSNSWLIEMAGKRLLLDPWLVGPLVFGNLPWLFKGEKQAAYPLPEPIDAIVLSQGLEDHAHPPTLERLDRRIPVVASPNGAKVVRELGYPQVTALNHGEVYNLDDRVEIQAVPGSPIGPQLVENGYIFKASDTQQTLYYEPHGFHSPSLKGRSPVDVAITPLMDLTLLGVAPILKGQQAALELCEWLRPQVILPTAAAGNVRYEGLLAAVIREGGSLDRFRAGLAERHLPTQVVVPKPGEAIELALAGGSSPVFSDRP